MFIWHEERVEILTKLWSDGMDAASIAHHLDPTGDVTKNSVIGKAARLKLGKHPAIARMAPTRRKRIGQTPEVKPGAVHGVFWAARSRKLPHKEAPAMAPEPVADPLMLTFDELSNSSILTQCRFPYGEDARAMQYCGHPTVDDGPYCPCHTKLCTPGKYAVKS